MSCNHDTRRLLTVQGHESAQLGGLEDDAPTHTSEQVLVEVGAHTVHHRFRVLLDEPHDGELTGVGLQLLLRNVDRDHDPVRLHLELLDLLATGHVHQLVADVDADTTSRGSTSEGALDVRSAFLGHTHLLVQRLEQLIGAYESVGQRTAQVSEGRV